MDKKLNLIVSSDLCQPPSEVICFRDLTLAASDRFDSILVECNGIEKDFIWGWLKRFGAMDYVTDLILPYEEFGYSIRLNYSRDTNILVDEKLWVFNIEPMIQHVIK